MAFGRTTSVKVQRPHKQKFVVVLFVLLFASVGVYYLFSSYADTYPHNNFQAPTGTDVVYSDFAGANWVDHSTGETFTQTAYIAYNLLPGPARQIDVYFSYNPDLVSLQSVHCTTSWGCKKSQWNGTVAGAHKGTGFVVCVDAPVGNYKDQLIYTMKMQAKRNLNGGGGNGYAGDAWFVDSASITHGSCSSNPTASGAQWSWLQGRCGVVNGNVYPDCYSGASPDAPGFTGFSALVARSTPQRTTTSNTSPTKSSSQGGGSSGGSSSTTQTDKPNSTPSSSSQGEKRQTQLDPSPFYDGRQYQQGSEKDSSLGGLFSKPNTGGLARVWYLVAGVALLVTGTGYLWWRWKRKA